jgi:hypothetical protein
MKQKIRIFRKGIVFFWCVGLALTARAQTSGGLPAGSELFITIRHMDSVLFDAFNSHDMPVLRATFGPDLEFYHDKGGRQNYAVAMASFEKVFATTPDLRRELIPNTLEVYPLPGFGAVEMGEHRFIHKENGKEVVGVFKFTHVWQHTGNEWRVTRVISVGH